MTLSSFTGHFQPGLGDRNAARKMVSWVAERLALRAARSQSAERRAHRAHRPPSHNIASEVSAGRGEEAGGCSSFP